MSMKFKLSPSRAFASAMMLGIVLAGCAPVPTEPSPDLQRRIESARTSSDHEGLATYYRQEAAVARAKSAEHRKLAKLYEGRAPDPRSRSELPSHCNAIVNMYERIAAEYDGMAESHQQLALQAKP